MQERGTARARAFFLGGRGGGGARWYGTCVDHHEHEAGSWKLELELELESANLLLLCSVCLSIYLSTTTTTTTTTTARERAQPQLHGLGRALQKRTLQERDTAALRDY